MHCGHQRNAAVRSLRAEEEILPGCLLRRPSGAHRPAGLVPEHDDLLVGPGDHPRVHDPFVPGWLQGAPDLVEAGPVAGLQGHLPVAAPAVGRGRRLAELDLMVV